MYFPTDKFLKKLKQEIRREFNRLSVMSFDEINALQVKDETKKLFERLLRYNQAGYEKIAREAYSYALEFIPEKKDGKFNAPLLVAMAISAYNPVTGYLYKSEAERKRLRLSEEILTAREYLDRESFMKAIRKTANLWFTQSMQYSLEVEDRTVLTVWENSGIKKVKWIAEDDKRTCSICRKLNGKIFPITNVPPKQHYNCRCYIIPVKDGAAVK